MDYKIISADVHITEPPDIWKNHLPQKYQEHAPKLVKDHEGGDAYNGFAFDEFAVDSKRQIPMYQIPSTGVDNAVRYLEKAKEKGAKGVVIGCWPSGKEILSEEDDKFWAALVESGLPLTIHINVIGRESRMKAQQAGSTATQGVKKAAPNANQRAIGGMAGVFAMVPPTLGNMIFQGVFDRFPDLKVVLIETGVGWIPHFLEQLDDRYWRNRGWGEIHIKEPPSYYWYKNFAATFIMDVIGLQIRHAVGVENMMWSTDYPHHGCD